MLARVISAAANGIETFPVEAEVNCGREDTVIAVIVSLSPIVELSLLQPETAPLGA